eukprot:TRINITY_DN46994_c0_g1_i1.p1 TRINITY_DN46994_c0_g1~~TRINITY_DN46994_c0_g1_i1.p1  ORF type:complete len:150 (-),score=22.91 TRINITY_DN46994_c0_g1_i1:155-604(-)
MSSNRHADWDINCKIYIGGLSASAERYDLEDAFSKYGPVRNVWVARRPPGFGFVEMEDPRDAQDAARSLDGGRIAGNRVRVEMSNGKSRDRDRRGRRRSRSRSRDRSRSREYRRPRRSPSYSAMERRRSPSRSKSRSRGRYKSRSKSRS